METGKTSRYFKYAFGEIVLVVIGILIALSINNWNENRKLENDKFKLIHVFKQEFLSNKKELENHYNGLKTSNVFLNKLLHFSADSTVSLPVDSLRLYSSKMVYLYQLSLLNSVQEEAISSRKFELLNDSLKAMLSKYKDYTNALNSLKEDSMVTKSDDDRIFELTITLSTFQSMFDLTFQIEQFPYTKHSKKTIPILLLTLNCQKRINCYIPSIIKIC
ncbi:hypothetical protein DI383_00650 [Flavobacteriaceae bacterium LYZ1037]|nr:hypothetical protein DI383_00650 [Flavobacteriaceae bacterium LYZ1037]